MTHPFAAHLERVAGLEPQRVRTPADGALPSLYLSHGAPPTFEDAAWMREHGVLVIGSGFMTHGLPYLDWSRPDQVPGWSRHFDDWAAEALERGDVDELAGFRSHAPGMPYAHPTVEHFTPLFVTLGAATDPGAPPTTTIDGYRMGLSKRSFQAA